MKYKQGDDPSVYVTEFKTTLNKLRLQRVEQTDARVSTILFENTEDALHTWTSRQRADHRSTTRAIPTLNATLAYLIDEVLTTRAGRKEKDHKDNKGHKGKKKSYNVDHESDDGNKEVKRRADGTIIRDCICKYCRKHGQREDECRAKKVKAKKEKEKKEEGEKKQK